MKLDAVGIASSDLTRTIEFYTLLGFEFPELKGDEEHIEAIETEGSARLMIDKKELITDIMGEEPKPSNHSQFAIKYDSADEVNEVADKVKKADFKIVKQPWDAFWGQRYCIVADPDDYKVDLYANL